MNDPRLEEVLTAAKWPAPLSKAVAERYAAVCDHPLYSEIKTLPELRVFMEHHIWAVWDFMSLLKSVQLALCPARVPWTPPADPESARLINEAVVEEESGLWIDGRALSHFEWYLKAMDAAGADTAPIRNFLTRFSEKSFARPLLREFAPASSALFVESTLRIALRALPVRLAALCLGREQLVPKMFPLLQAGTASVPGADLAPFTYYLSRHVEVDGDSHGPATTKLVARYCEGSEEAALGALEALDARKALWDGVLQQIRNTSSTGRI